MEDTTKSRIVPLDDKSDYALWRIRIRAAISARKLGIVFDRTADKEDDKVVEKMEEASNLIVSALSDHALRVVRSVIGDPAAMMAKLDDRYDSKTTASKITKMVELVSVRYSSLKESMPRHVDKIAALVEQLRSMGTTLDEPLVIGILIASLTVDELKPASAAIKTLSDEKLQWEDVTARLIEEVKTLKSDRGQSSRQATHDERSCAICGLNNHRTGSCYLNPLNKLNKLGLTESTVRDISEHTGFKSGGSPSRTPKKGKSKKKTGAPPNRSAMAKVNKRGDDLMMLDSGTTAHMTPHGNRLVDARKHTTEIALADDSAVRSSEVGVRPVRWSADGTTCNVSLSETLYVPDMTTSLLSVPALVSKNIAVLFIPGKAVLIDLDDDNNVLGYANQNSDGLFYISEDDRKSNRSDKKPRHWNTAMMAKVKSLMSKANPTARKNRNAVNKNTVMENVENIFDADTKLSTDSESEPKEADSSNAYSDADSAYSGSGTDSHHNEDLDAYSPPYSNSEKSKTKSQSICKELNSNAAAVWHRRLGHAVGVKAIRLQLKNKILPRPVCTHIDCEDCTKGKFRRRFGGSLTKRRKIGHLHVDTKGKIETESVDGHKYFLTIVEEVSRHTTVIPIRTKRDASEEVLNYVSRFERQTDRTVKSIHSDGGSEFDKAFKHLERLGVDSSRTTPYTPQSNGLAERSHGIILSMARTCLSQAGLPFGYWNYAVWHVADCKNAVVHSATGKIPHEVLYGEPAPYLHHLKPFGCQVYYQKPVRKHKTFEERSRSGMCLMHDAGGLYYICCDPSGDAKVIRTKHVRFIEDHFPAKLDHCKQRGPTVNTDSESDENAYSSSDESTDSDSDCGEVELDDNHTSYGIPSSEPSSSSDTGGEDGNEDADNGDDISHPSDDDPLITKALTYTPARPSRYGESDGDADHQEETDRTRGGDSRYSLRDNPRPPVRYTNMALPKVVTTGDEPKLSVALRSTERDYWLEAIREEFDTLEENGTWEVVENVPRNAKVLPSGIILRIKRDEDNDPARFKARLVARGNFQTILELEMDLYAPVACIEMVRLMIAVAVALRLDIHQIDVKGAFLHAQLPDGEEIFMRLPKIPGLDSVSGKLVRLIKSLYGLRQAPRLWYQCFAEAVLGLGFKRAESSFCLFVKETPTGAIYVIVYVDDILIIGKPDGIRETKDEFKKLFTVTDLGVCHYFLGMKLDYSTDGLLLSQSGYTERVIEAANMVQCKPARTPLPLSHPLYEKREPTTDSEKMEMQDIPYRNLLGKLLYLANRTRPDLAVAVSLLAKFQNDPAPRHWKALKHVVRYLKGTPRYGLIFPSGGSTKDLVVHCDADWGRDLEKRRSRTGYVIYYESAPVLWKSKLQTATATSTCEAEFAALSDCVRDIGWMRRILMDAHQSPNGPTRVYQDNLGTISWSADMIGLRKVKHVQIKFNNVCDEVENRSVNVDYIPSSENRADSLTKVLIGEQFASHRNWLGVVPITEDAHDLEGAC